MRACHCRILLVLICLLPAASLPAGEQAPAPDFIRDIRPILSDNCFVCHGPDAEQRQADLRLDTREGASHAIEAGDSASSELFARISSDDPDLVMPPPGTNRSLSARQIDLLKRWIDAGANWGTHWSFAPPERPPVPPIASAAPQRNPIDAFVQERLGREGLAAAPSADRETLIRRVTLDLTGLPPTPEQVEAFLRDSRPGAYERLVDRLLAAPAYGERMAWDWLDAARYADSNGYQGDRERTMWPWRDWVVQAFNQNLPYDQFTVWQLAGDLLPEATAKQQLATGFCRNHMINGEGGRIAEENRVDYVMDMAETTGTVWLGLTFNCCRCHDHKYDPLTRRDYYELFAFFNQTPVTGAGGNPQTPPLLAVPSTDQRRQLANLETRLRALQAELKRGEVEQGEGAPDSSSEQVGEASPENGSEQVGEASPENGSEQLGQASPDKSSEQLKRLREQAESTRKQLDSLRKAVPQVMVMADQSQRRPTYMLDRGLYNKPGEQVEAALPDFLAPLADASSPAGDPPLDRLDLARWLVSPANPLTARVTVNRFWQQLFGMGLVKTAEDFGSQGEIPIHRELLDWLACEFRESGWDVKRLLRLIVTSHAYRQSSAVDAALYERDPENRLLARGPRFRLPSWMLRDQALAAGGLLSARKGGTPVNGYQPAGVWEEATFGKKQYSQDHGEALYRRSLYTFWRRIIAPTVFFDNASRQTCTVKPLRTNTPLHALLTFNDVTYVEAARALAARTLEDGSLADDAERVDAAYRRVLARVPGERERRILLEGLERTRRQFGEDPEAAERLLAVGESPVNGQLDRVEHASWTALCLAILNLDSALTKE